MTTRSRRWLAPVASPGQRRGFDAVGDGGLHGKICGASAYPARHDPELVGDAIHDRQERRWLTQCPSAGLRNWLDDDLKTAIKRANDERGRRSAIRLMKCRGARTSRDRGRAGNVDERGCVGGARHAWPSQHRDSIAAYRQHRRGRQDLAGQGGRRSSPMVLMRYLPEQTGRGRDTRSCRSRS